MPEYYPSIGEAIGAAMKHNIRLAHGEAPGVDKPLQVRYIPSPSADPYSVPGMLARLTERAGPDEVAAIIEEVNDTLVGALPQVTELVAAAADWTRVRLNFDDPDHNPTFKVWQQLAFCTRMLRDVQSELEAVQDGIATCPAELSDPRHHDVVNVLRTRELLSDVFADDAAQATAPAAVPAEEPESDRQRAALATSPTATAQRVQPSGDPVAEPPATNPAARPPRTR